MKIRTATELVDRIDQELSWRKRELTALESSVSSEKRPHHLLMLRRSAVVLLYAHWEGFVKSSAGCYLELVSRQQEPYKRLRSNFVALGFRKSLNEASESRSAVAHLSAVNFIRYELGQASKLPYDGVVDTKSNLSYDVLENIFHLLGIDIPSAFTLKGLEIDGKLLEARNAIAHGQFREVDDETYRELRVLVLAMLEWFRTEIQNAATQKAYLV
jgi:hypothetical protein